MNTKCNTGFISDIEKYNYHEKMYQLANRLFFFGLIGKKQKTKLLKKSSFHMAKMNSFVILD